jgi:hypothetical protein
MNNGSMNNEQLASFVLACHAERDHPTLGEAGSASGAAKTSGSVFSDVVAIHTKGTSMVNAPARSGG